MTRGIQKIYSQVPHTYELVNHVLTLGFDMRWRKRAAEFATKKGGTLWLDVCSGTGEMAVNLAGLRDENTQVFAADFSLPMIAMAASKNDSEKINFTIANVKSLPFKDNTFDLITISFATRNINKNREFLVKCLKEFNRILKKDGSFVNLETSQPKSRILRRLFHLYVSLFVRRIGQLISGSKSGYTYLSSTIPRFYDADEFSEIIKDADFTEVTYKQMLFGAAAIHEGIKT